MSHMRTLARTTVLALTLAAAPLLSTPTLATAAPVTPPSDLVENFDTFPAAGWTINGGGTTPVGSKDPWYEGDVNKFDAHSGAPGSYAAANYQAATGDATISSWLISPLIRDVSAGDTLSFFTRIVEDNDEIPDRLEVRMSTAASCRAGTTTTDVGDFTTLLLSVNPTLITGVYPMQWTQFNVTIPKMAPTTGCVAFRYFVTNGGNMGANSYYIGVDTVKYTQHRPPVTPPKAAKPQIRTPKTVRASKKFAVSITGLPTGAKVKFRFNGKSATRTAKAGTVKVKLRAPKATTVKKAKLRISGAVKATRTIKVRPARR